jgi:hypothetical protein
VAVAVHRQRDGRVPGECFGIFRLNPSLHQFGNKPVPQRVDVGGAVVRIPVRQEVARPAGFPLGVGLGLSDPRFPCSFKVTLTQPPSSVVLRPSAGPACGRWGHHGEPGA